MIGDVVEFLDNKYVIINILDYNQNKYMHLAEYANDEKKKTIKMIFVKELKNGTYEILEDSKIIDQLSKITAKQVVTKNNEFINEANKLKPKKNKWAVND